MAPVLDVRAEGSARRQSLAVLASMRTYRNARESLAPPPESLLELLDALARERLGGDDLRGEALARAVQRVSRAYLRQGAAPAELSGDPRALCARLKFFLPRDWPKVTAPLAELAATGALPAAPSLRVLDLGAGLLATGLAAARFALDAGAARVRIDAVERDGRALELGTELGQRLARAERLALELRPRQAALTPGLLQRLDPPYDLILLGFVLNELAQGEPDPAAQHAGWLTRLAPLLSDDGAIVVLEPALRAHSRALQQARGLLASAAGPPFVFAPCLHREACPLLARERDWCHEQLALPLPAPVAQLARAAGLRGSDLTFSYLTLHHQPRSLAELGAGARLLRMVSSPLPTKGKLELMVCGAGPARRLRRLDRARSEANQALEAAARGTLLALDGEAGRDGEEVAEIGRQTHVERVL